MEELEFDVGALKNAFIIQQFYDPETVLGSNEGWSGKPSDALLDSHDEDLVGFETCELFAEDRSSADRFPFSPIPLQFSQSPAAPKQMQKPLK
jgi:hypothetical protein